MKRLILLIFALYSIKAIAQPDNDFQSWNIFEIKGNLSDKVSLTFQDDFRISSDLEKLYYNHSDIGVKIEISTVFSLGINYRQIFELKSSVWKQENVPHINGTFKFSLNKISIEDRSRIEYKIKEGSDNYFRYRNKLTLSLKEGIFSNKIKPFVADEVFYNLEDPIIFSRNRFYLGFSYEASKMVVPKLYYLWQSSRKDNTWTDYNIVGFELKFNF